MNLTDAGDGGGLMADYSLDEGYGESGRRNSSFQCRKSEKEKREERRRKRAAAQEDEVKNEREGLLREILEVQKEWEKGQKRLAASKESQLTYLEDQKNTSNKSKLKEIVCETKYLQQETKKLLALEQRLTSKINSARSKALHSHTLQNLRQQKPLQKSASIAHHSKSAYNGSNHSMAKQNKIVEEAKVLANSNRVMRKRVTDLKRKLESPSHRVLKRQELEKKIAIQVKVVDQQKIEAMKKLESVKRKVNMLRQKVVAENRKENDSKTGIHNFYSIEAGSLDTTKNDLKISYEFEISSNAVKNMTNETTPESIDSYNCTQSTYRSPESLHQLHPLHSRALIQSVKYYLPSTLSHKSNQNRTANTKKPNVLKDSIESIDHRHIDINHQSNHGQKLEKNRVDDKGLRRDFDLNGRIEASDQEKDEKENVKPVIATNGVHGDRVNVKSGSNLKGGTAKVSEKRNFGKKLNEKESKRQPFSVIEDFRAQKRVLNSCTTGNQLTNRGVKASNSIKMRLTGCGDSLSACQPKSGPAGFTNESSEDDKDVQLEQLLAVKLPDFEFEIEY